MKRLFLLRHAKTEAALGAKQDIDRVLLERGRRDAIAMAQYFVGRGLGCERVLCSTAARTRETLALFQPVALAHATQDIRDDLYLAEATELLDIVRSLDDKVSSVMLIGHNPGMEELALMLAGPPLSIEAEALHRRLREKFSTSALAVIGFDVPLWRDLRPGRGVLEDFMRPRDLGPKGD